MSVRKEHLLYKTLDWRCKVDLQWDTIVSFDECSCDTPSRNAMRVVSLLRTDIRYNKEMENVFSPYVAKFSSSKCSTPPPVVRKKKNEERQTSQPPAFVPNIGKLVLPQPRAPIAEMMEWKAAQDGVDAPDPFPDPVLDPGVFPPATLVVCRFILENLKIVDKS
jgi:hypothetical protein